MDSEDRLKRNNFDVLRLLLAVGVIFSHSFALLSCSNETEPLYRFSLGQITFGELGVDGFFILSGFLVTYSLARSKDGWNFLLKRACRIYPGFIVLTLLTAIALVFVRPETLHDAYPINVGILTLRGYDPGGVFRGNPNDALNGSLWSVNYEAWCYVGVLGLGLLGLVRPKVAGALLFLATLTSVAFLASGWDPGGKILGVVFGIPKLWARMLPYFLSGMLFYSLKDKVQYSVAGALMAGAMALIAFRIPLGVAMAFPLLLGYLLFSFAFSNVPLQDWAKQGDASYGTYLYAFPVQQLLIHFVRPAHPILLFLMATPISVLLGYVSWHGVEKRFLARSREKTA